MIAFPDLPSLVALTTTNPADTAVTSPLGLTVAFEMSDDAQVGGGPGNGSPVGDSVRAVSCSAVPAGIVAATGVTSTESTLIRTTVSAVAPCCPSLVAVTVTGPAATPVTWPLALTMALVVSELDHDTVRPVSRFPAASNVAAVNCSAIPT